MRLPNIHPLQWSAAKGIYSPERGLSHMFVPVLDRDQRPLMPTTPSRARRWLKSGKATAFWKGGLFCVRLNFNPSAREGQSIAVGIDPGSKREGYSVASAAHTYLNIQAEARQGVKEAEKDSTRMRRTRRYRKTPCRKPRPNRKQGALAVETAASSVLVPAFSSPGVCGRGHCCYDKAREAPLEPELFPVGSRQALVLRGNAQAWPAPPHAGL